MQAFLLILAVLPVIFISCFVYMRDKNREPGRLLFRLFFLGIISCFLTLSISEVLFGIIPFLQKETSFMNIFEVMFYSFVGVALVEEFSKWIMVYRVTFKSRIFDERYDGIVYAVFVSLGFAFFENLGYVFKHFSISVALMRAILAVPGHACDAVFMGYYLSIARYAMVNGNKKLAKKNLILSLVAPTVLHGIYDFCLFSNVNILIIVFVIFVFFLFTLSFRIIMRLSRKGNYAIKNNNPNFNPNPAPNPNLNANNINNVTIPNNNLVNINGNYISTSQNFINNYVNPTMGSNNNYSNSNINNNLDNDVNSSTTDNNMVQCPRCGAIVSTDICPKCGYIIR